MRAVTLKGRQTGLLYRGWLIPDRGQHPSEEMVDWLHDKFDPGLWDGDDEGIVVYANDGLIEEEVLGTPGKDFIVQDPISEAPMIIKAEDTPHYIVKEGHTWTSSSSH